MTGVEAVRERRDEAIDLVLREAETLDRGDYEAWLALFTDDAVYWVPERADGDPRTSTSLIYDDRARMEDRVWRLLSGAAHAQIPASRTVRLVSNARVVAGDGGELVVHSALAIVEARGERERVLAGRCEHRLRDDGTGLRIARKTVVLVNRSHFQYNLTIIV